MNQNTVLCPFFGVNYMVVGNDNHTNNKFCICMAFIKYLLTSYCYIIKNDFCNYVAYCGLLLITSVGLSVFIFLSMFVIINFLLITSISIIFFLNVKMMKTLQHVSNI